MRLFITAGIRTKHLLQDYNPLCLHNPNDDSLEIDKNLAENAVRLFVFGRNQGTFSDWVYGVEASANLYSLVEYAKAKTNRLEPCQFLRSVLMSLPLAETVEDIERLRPRVFKKVSAVTS